MEDFMSRKSDKIQKWIEKYPGNYSNPYYHAYFEMFNSQRYYEAHDVLEHLWLLGGKEEKNYRFYKGMIQMAGGFVHLKLHWEHPDHRIHGRRLQPAAKLFRLAGCNFEGYPDVHMGLEMVVVRKMCEEWDRKLGKSNYQENPWRPDKAPLLKYDDHLNV